MGSYLLGLHITVVLLGVWMFYLSYRIENLEKRFGEEAKAD